VTASSFRAPRMSMFNRAPSGPLTDFAAFQVRGFSWLTIAKALCSARRHSRLRRS
jgi:hypothetical protein